MGYRVFRLFARACDDLRDDDRLFKMKRGAYWSKRRGKSRASTGFGQHAQGEVRLYERKQELIGERPVFFLRQAALRKYPRGGINLRGQTGFFRPLQGAQYFDRRLRLKTLGPDELEKAYGEVGPPLRLSTERLEGRI